MHGKKTKKHIFYLILFLFTIGLFFKILYILYYPQIPVTTDAMDYDELGWNIASGIGFSHNGSPEINRGPVYPFFLSSVYYVFGHNYSAVRIFQAIVSSLMVVFVYWIACEIMREERGGGLFSGESIGLLSSALVAFYPAFISYSGLLLTETIFTILLVITTMALLKAENNNSLPWAAISGIFMGGALLCRPEVLIYPFILVLCMIAISHRTHADKCVKIKLYLFYLLITIFTMLPWTIRNYIAFNKIIPVATGGKSLLWLASQPDDWTEWHYDREPLKSLSKGVTSNIELEDKLFKEAVKNIKKYPLSYAKLGIKRFFRFWVGSHSNSFYGLTDSFIQSLRDGKYMVFFLKSFLMIINMGIIGFGIIGVFAGRKMWRFSAPILVLIVYKTVIHTLLFGTPRYQVPLMSFVIIFSAMGILWAGEKSFFAKGKIKNPAT